MGCNDLRVTGKKREQKMYYKHTTRPGVGFKQINMERVFSKYGGGEVLRRAVSGMLPKNTAYQFFSGDPGVVVIQTCKGQVSVEKWAQICQVQ